MPYVIASAVFAILAIFETSFLPIFSLWGVVPFLTLSLLVVVSVKYRGYFHFFLALFLGMYLDFISSGVPGLFTGTFVTVALIGRSMFFRDTGYDASQSIFWLLGLSSTFIYLVNTYYLFQINLRGWQTYLFRSVWGVFLTLAVGFIMLRISERFVDGLNKVNEEKFR